jgi:chromosome segregation ATPase
MKISDVLTEAVPVSAPSNVGRDYINMLNFVKSSGLEGVPADQQVAVALFKELQKQQQKNTQLGRELSAAEKRIDQATQSGELYGQELATHQAELERERGEIERQKEKMGQIDQAYAGRAQASEQQMRSLTDQLDQLKTKPGVDKSTAEQLQNQIEKLKKEGIGQDKFNELQKNIESIQSMQTVDDRVIQDLVAQIKSAESAAAEMGRTKQELGQALDKATKDALDQVAQMKQDLARLNQVTAKVQTTVADAIPAQLDSISTKVAELEAENEDQFNELTKHEDWLTAVAPNAEPRDKGALAPARNQFNLPGVPAATADNQLALPGVNTTPAPVNPAAAKIAQQATQQKANLARAQGIDVVEPDDNLAESRFRELIRWATK